MRPCLITLAAVVFLTSGSPSARSADGVSDEIPLRIVVTDRKGRALTGLSATDIEIYEGERKHAVKSFVALQKASRTFGILFDDYHVSETAAARAVPALLEFVDRLRPEDLVFVMRPLDPASSLKPVEDRDELRAIISAFAGRKGNYAPRNAFEAEYLSAAPPSAARQRAQIVRAAMQALATAMSTRGAAKAMIAVTEGFAPDERGRERLATLRTVARVARLGNVAVYVVDPSGAANDPPMFGEQWSALTSQTGGVLTSGGPPESALLQVSSDLDASFLLTIGRPEKEDGAHHPLEIKLKRKDAALRAPTGYWAPIAAERLTPPLRPAMSTYLKTPHVSGLIQPWFRMTRAAAGRTGVTFSWMPKSPRSPGARVALSAITFEGKKLIEADVAPQAVKADVTRSVFEAAPGPIQVSMAITDASGKLLDTEVRYIDVPALDSGATTITAVEVVRTRTLRQFLERQLEADAMPVETREFDRQDRLIVRVRAFAGGPEAPVVHARLLNPRGQLIRDLTPLPPIEGTPQFDLPLASYARGDYRIEIRATAGASTTAQLISFRLIG